MNTNLKSYLENKHVTMLFAFFLLFQISHSQIHKGKKVEKPNVVFIMVDDLGWKDVGFMGSTFYETPNIDKLASKGMVFMNAYTASPLCSATRASIITGTYPARNGLTSAAGHLKKTSYTSRLTKSPRPNQKAIQAISASRIDPNKYTLAEAFKDAGYNTAHIGKWHIGEEPSDPLTQGFDVDIPQTNAPSPLGKGWFAPWPVYKGKGQEGDHLEDRMAQEAANYIKKNNPSKTGKPFLLNYWAFSVHSPWNAKQELIDKFEKKANYYESQHSAVYAAMVASMDEAVGKLMSTLKKENLLKNTIVIFYSDNGGWYLGARKHVHPDYTNSPLGSNYPLRGGKASIYEGGTRVPLAISWPKQINAGVNEQTIVSSVDIYPTLLDLCGIKPKEKIVLDGISFKPAFSYQKINRDEIYCHFPHYIKATGNVPSTYVRKGDWKLIKHYHDGDNQAHRFELFNLKKDIGETLNLSKVFPNKVKELDNLIEQHLINKGGIKPIANPNYIVRK